MNKPQPVPSQWQKSIDTFESRLRADGLMERSIQTRLRHIRTFARSVPELDPTTITAEELVTWAGSRTWAKETRHSYYVSLRRFFSLIRPDDSPAAGLPSIERPIGAPRPIPEKLYQQSLHSPIDERSQAILILAGRVGLRRSEIPTVNIRDMFEDLGGWSLTVVGKGDKRRTIPLSDETAALLLHMGSQSPEGWVFPSRAGGHIGSEWLGKLASRVLPEGWSLHTLRHRFATRAYSGERDILAVQRLLGHTNVATTQRYTAPPDDALRRAVEAAR
ncbi:tyrosine-type recombinase/integrase [Actinomyces urogenitalis]|uniref:tyrosine-type recombinase/integrase n=1 Tax=Actinomyces urogenitalis TaxID=103621 RepID=UPI00242AE844|nr:tyrosine-type recombinase/integrase [Actinomyces urogenitalis]MCI7456324.1 tyrosine-type recombinase/integrase [Actinomyces urogenitalis]